MTYKVSLLILNQDKQVLACARENRLALPEVEVEPGRVGISLTRAVRKQLNLRVFCLVLPESETGDHPVLRLQSPGADLPVGFRWFDAADLPEREATQRVIDQAYPGSEDLGGYAWYEQVSAWLKEKLALIGYSVRELEQWNGRIGGVLLRVTTDGPPFWFKAVSDFNAREMAIAQLLSKRSPAHFPRIFAAEPKWNAFLLEHVEGTELYDADDLSVWEETAKLLADVQMEWVGAAEPMLRAGAADLRASAMIERIPAFLGHIEEAMARQPKSPPERLTRIDLDELEVALQALSTEVAALDIPDGLANADFSPHNTLVTRAGPVFIDWAEACVSLPLIAGEYMWNRMAVESPERIQWQGALRAAYLGRWRERYGAPVVERAARLLPAFSIFAVAMFYHERESRGASPYDSYLRSLARKLNQAITKVYGQRYALQA